MRRYHLATLLVALAAAACFLLSGPGTKEGWFDWRTGLVLFRTGAWIGVAALVLALVGFGLVAMPKWRVWPWMPVASLALGALGAAPPIVFLQQAKAVPPIHDITTDTADPPAFVALAAAREASPNKSAYGGPEVAAQQKKAYPDLDTKALGEAPAAAMQKAIDVARALGWEVVATDAATGRLEATQTTRWFGFKDDVVVRIRPDGKGSRVDVRSVSRVGRSDVGANARRIRMFLDRL